MSSPRSMTSRSPQRPSQQRLLRGREYLRHQQWQRAEAELSAAVLEEASAAQAMDWLGLAIARWKQNNIEGCIQASTKAFSLDPSSIPACMVLTQALMGRHRYGEAVRIFESLQQPAPAEHDFHANYGISLLRSGRAQDAVPELLQALQYKIDSGLVHSQLGFAFKELKLFEEAVECFRTAVALDPDNLCARAFIVHLDQFACRWDSFDTNCAELIEAVRKAARQADPQGVESTPFVLAAIPHSPKDFLEAARLEARRLARNATPLEETTAAAPGPVHRKIRIGYLSSDFYQHATAMLFTEVLERRDTQRFDVYLYSHGPDDKSPMRDRIMKACEHFVDVAHLGPRETAERIRQDDIDILVDLKGYTADNRFATLAYRPAPVQVSYLGFPGTTGAEYIDYVIGDPYVTPLEHASHFSEKIAQMPVCYQPNDRQRPLPQPSTRQQWGLPEQGFVFGCFNQAYKIIPETFDAWMLILHAVPGSVLWLLDGGEQAQINLRREAEHRGIEGCRLIFGSPIKPEQHISRLSHVDLVLDTWPYNAHTTASDALWAGVPVLTLCGETFASRVATSLVHAVGLGDSLVCHSVEAYAHRAIELAGKPEVLKRMRAHLTGNRHQAPLFDSSACAQGLEALYVRMHERRCAALPPDHLPAQPIEERNAPEGGGYSALPHTEVVATDDAVQDPHPSASAIAPHSQSENRLRDLERALLARDLSAISQRVRKRRLVLFFGRDTFSDNSKYAYLCALARTSNQQVLWCGFDPTLLDMLRKNGLPCFDLGADLDASIDLLLHAAVAVFCVNPNESLRGSAPFVACLDGARKIQLWHGVSVKHLSFMLIPHMGVTDERYRQPFEFASRADYVLSTASRFDRYWRDVFGCRTILRSGLPRNEVLVRPPTQHELLGSELPVEAEAELQSQSRRNVLVVPTWQRGQTTWLTETDCLVRLAQLSASEGINFHFKVHPLYLYGFGATDRKTQGLRFLNPGVDIYPHLSRYDALVTDYSSIMFDFLLTGKPVLSLDLDQHQHQRFEPDFSLVPDLDFRLRFTPSTFETELLQALQGKRPSESRQMVEQLFETPVEQSCNGLIDLIDRLVDASQADDFTVENTFYAR